MRLPGRAGPRSEGRLAFSRTCEVTESQAAALGVPHGSLLWVSSKRA